MRIIIAKIFLLLLCLSLFSCKKKIEDDYRPEFIGHWYCPLSATNNDQFSFSITIDSNSHAVYTEWYAGYQASTTLSGKARADDKHFKIGRFHSFKIIDYPHKIDTASSNVYVIPQLSSKKPNWEMTLDHPLFYAGKGTYYKADY
ncbi:MAG: hypothetical protein ABR968_09115 [Bacteroidales bacterium]|jgi:hypothetical protein